MSKSRLINRVALVTGAGRGIGREIALAVAAEGAKVMVNDPGGNTGGTGSDLVPADQVVSEIQKAGGVAVPSYDSVVDFRAAEQIVKSCIDTFGSVDVLVNCAGILRDRMLHNMSEEEWDMVIGVHLKGTFNMCRHASGHMRSQRFGRIITIASAAWLGSTGQANYGAAKGGIVSLTRTMARELGRYGVTCNCIVPMAATRMTLDEAVKAKFTRQFEEGAITRARYEELVNMPGPEHIAPLAVYIASDEAANVNGVVFRSAGGTLGIYSEPSIAKIIYQNIAKEGPWKVDELTDLIPKILLAGYVNPAPLEPGDKHKQ